ncbi:MAG: acetylpolyamine amidohydrolase [Deltaproteobacteria bacterium]|nr:acetylpolyamine amidohydrolase [Deltaproteobacteria bacterium]
MFRIRRIYDDTLPRDREAIVQVQAILRNQFNELDEKDIARLPHQLKNPLKYRFRSIIFIAEDSQGNVKGFALMQHAPDLGFCYLDYLSIEPERAGRGVGGALYDRVREEAAKLTNEGLFFECLPDEKHLCRDKQVLKQNRKRLKFYEQYGAYPIINTAYETPFKPEHDCPPYLVFDPLGRNVSLSRDILRHVIRAILKRKYGDSCPPGYIEMVESSVTDDPVRLRPPRYTVTRPAFSVQTTRSMEKRIALVVNDKHDIHHVHERGYVEAPARIQRILEGIEGMDLFDRMTPRHFPEKNIKAIHNTHYVEYFKRMCSQMQPGISVYPYVFPIRNKAHPPREMPVRAGYYCIDTFTPLNRNAYLAAKRAVDCALTVAQAILDGYRLAYALVRPPGHHAERNAFGGFCYFNSAAVAAHFLSRYGKVAVLDIDYHHGNGTQDIFYERQDVLTISIHGHPRSAYPYFSGFRNERGEDSGEGFNINYPLPEKIDAATYTRVLRKALHRISRFRATFLLVAFGLDTAKGDPTGTWNLSTTDFYENGRLIGTLGLPTIIVQEGGYRSRSLGSNAGRFFMGLWEGFHGIPPSQRKGRSSQAKKPL